MSLSRIKAILVMEWFITKRSLEVLVDVVFFPLINIIVFGFLSVYLTGNTQVQHAYPLLVGMILWQLVYITQYSISVGSLWNIWARNLSNIFLTPITVAEYIMAFVISGSLKALFILFTSSILSFYAFHFNMLSLGIANLALFFVNLTIFAIATGIVILGLIFRYGTRIQALAWSITFLFQPLTAAFFPVSVLPGILKNVAYLFPATYVFEAARAAIVTPAIRWDLFLYALILNLIYLPLSVWVYTKLFRKSKDTGQFARNEG
jgi:ABC-2 type transport system permease protein